MKDVKVLERRNGMKYDLKNGGKYLTVQWGKTTVSMRVHFIQQITLHQHSIGLK